MDMPFSTEFRPIVAHTPLEGVLAFRQMFGTEGISSLFEFECELVAESYSLDLQQLLGKSLTIESNLRADRGFWMGKSQVQFGGQGKQ